MNKTQIEQLLNEGIEAQELVEHLLEHECGLHEAGRILKFLNKEIKAKAKADKDYQQGEIVYEVVKRHDGEQCSIPWIVLKVCARSVRCWHSWPHRRKCQNDGEYRYLRPYGSYYGQLLKKETLSKHPVGEIVHGIDATWSPNSKSSWRMNMDSRYEEWPKDELLKMAHKIADFSLFTPPHPNPTASYNEADMKALTESYRADVVNTLLSIHAGEVEC